MAAILDGQSGSSCDGLRCYWFEQDSQVANGISRECTRIDCAPILMCHRRNDSWDLNILRGNGQLDPRLINITIHVSVIVSHLAIISQLPSLLYCRVRARGQSIRWCTQTHTGPIGSIKSCPTVVCPSRSLTHTPATCQENLPLSLKVNKTRKNFPTEMTAFSPDISPQCVMTSH